MTNIPNSDRELSVNLPKGFRYGGVAPGTKPSGKPDVSLIVADQPVVAAGVYTQNQIVAAPVVLSRSRTPASRIRAVITNSGNANACTGEQGDRDAAEMCAQVAALVGCDCDDVLVMSTGVIGQPLNMPAVQSGIEAAHGSLGSGPDDFIAAAEAIRTTDASRKTETCSIELSGKKHAIAAMAKGAGMIAPNMATMLAYVFTDAAIAPDVLDTALREACNNSFNAITVDSDTSTSDSLMVFATGASGAAPITSEDDDRFAAFRDALREVCLELALLIVKDGEGASKFVTVHVEGADKDQAARSVATDIANSPLVKTALAANDANWGRVVMAVGKSGEAIDLDALSIWFGDVQVAEAGGRAEDYDEEKASRAVTEPEITIRVRIGSGSGRATVYTCDLTHAYVDINGAYRT